MTSPKPPVPSDEELLAIRDQPAPLGAHNRGNVFGARALWLAGYHARDREVATLQPEAMSKFYDELKARIAELESLLTQAACDKIEATAFEAMKERLEKIESALHWVYCNSEFVQFGPKSLHLYKDGRAVEDGVSSFGTNWFDKETTGEVVADALIALSEEQGQ